tara:strand:+ start:517 stop:723 length:207 start_codon:yes stop_codon:yes gene_type:complete
MEYTDRMKRNLINTINMLSFTEENFKFLKEELIKSTFPKSISEQVKDKMTNIDRNFQEDMINDMDSLY